MGFEGIGQSVDSQLEGAFGMMRDTSLQPAGVQACHPITGNFSDHYKKLGQFNFLLRADVPLDRVVDFFVAVHPFLPLHYPFLDFGNGRLTLGVETLAKGEWGSIADRARELDGHALIEKAPVEFKQESDVFGRPRPEWRIMHRLKAALDPKNIFAPGCLPGKV